MRYLFVLVLIFCVVSTNSAYGHKLIFHDNTHTSIDSPLMIPNHKISWAIYDDLDANSAKFYSFDAKAGDSFYASIVVPKINGLENYSPTMILLNLNTQYDDTQNQLTQEKFLYEGDFPGSEFYEPFGQVTYWERQEIRTDIPVSGTYVLVVTDEKNQQGKYSLAVGTIEDFSVGDLFLILPKAWIETKFFVGDHASLGIGSLIVLIPIATIGISVLRKKSGPRTQI